MIAHEVAHKYSTALFNIVQEKKLIDQASEQFEQLDNLIKKDNSLLQFLLAPHILEQNKQALVKNVFGPRLEPLFLEFLLLLVGKHRIGYLHDIIEAFRDKVAYARGQIKAQVITAVPLTDDQRRKLTAKLNAKADMTVTLKEKVDSAIIGGMIVIMGDQIIDGSVRHNLLILKEELKKLKVNQAAA